MDLKKLIDMLEEHGLLDLENFSPRFTERIMRVGGVSVLQNQDADIAANLALSRSRIADCIGSYSPEKVEVYFLLQELANHARARFYGFGGGQNKGEKRRSGRDNRGKLMARVNELPLGSYKSGEIGEPIGLSSTSVGGFLSHLSEEEREELKLRYVLGKKSWEKYV